MNIMFLLHLLIKLFELKLYRKHKHVHLCLIWKSFGSVITGMSLKKKKR